MRPKTIGCVTAASLVFCGAVAARAADLPAAPVYKAPAAVAAYNWSGFYIGGNAGYGWGNAADNTAFNDPTFPVTDVHANHDRLRGALGGVQAGYNWQSSDHGVFGIEADWQYAHQTGGQGFTDAFLNPPQSFDTITSSAQSEIRWFGTIRARAGFSSESLLFYATGGFAYGAVNRSGTINENLTTPGFTFTGNTTFNVSRVNAGWTLGGGVEGKLAGNWTWKAEYLYLDLGSVSALMPADTPPSGIAVSGASTLSVHGRFTDNIARLGVNLRLN